jgi:twitching motility protein PilT
MAVAFYELLKVVVENGASDLHLASGAPPMLRIDGKLVPVKHPPLTPLETKDLCYSIYRCAET